jgi:hypothetical protein
MAITNGYATLLQVKQAMDIANTYTATTISFDTTTDTVSDSAYGLRRFQTGDIISIAGSTSNNGYFNIASGGNTPGSFTVIENLTTEVAGDTVVISVIHDQKDDQTIERAIESASRWIDNVTGTRFYRNGTDETREYTPEYPDKFFCPDDIGSITTLKTDDGGDGTFENTWTVDTDFRLKPANADLDSIPYTWIVTSPQGSYSFPLVDEGLQLVGKFGYCATGSYPTDVNQACIMLAQRYLKRKDAPLGVMGTQAMGFVRLEDEIDPDVKHLLQAYMTRRAYG